ncbi:molybdenum cofactor guanylyltransferase [Halomicrococcus sp. NG-SE-24]|uniref:molybdenum cofactor guanylyltransferase n=1 Tax=Halomicrococcus sp. NG-SE-24 TaxID=3436928 RepID=UPI003D998ECB
MTANQPITAVVLAGGRSQRFGDAPKATATLDGRPLVDRVVTRVRTTTERQPVVAAGPADKRTVIDNALSHDVRYTADADWCDGPLAGICGALDSISTAAVFLCGCDMPLVSPRAVSWLADHHATAATDATVPMDATGESQLLHGVYRTAALVEYCDRRPDTHRLRSIVTELSSTAVRPTATPDDVDLTRSMTNVNTRRELAAIEHPEFTNDVGLELQPPAPAREQSTD